MKRLFAFILALTMLTTSVSFAQTGKTKVTKVATSTTAHTKKDGSLDMRFKENKVKKDTTKHLKKDGTLDKRFKENKKK